MSHPSKHDPIERVESWLHPEPDGREAKELRLRGNLGGARDLSEESNSLGSLTAGCVDYVGYISYLSGDRHKMHQGLLRAIHWYTALYHVSGLQEPFEVTNLGEPLVLKTLDPSFTTSSSERYHRSFGLAWLGRDSALQEVLLRCSWKLFTNRPGVTGPPFMAQIDETFDLFATQAPHWHDVCVDTIAMMKPYAEPRGRRRLYFALAYSHLRVMEAFHTLDHDLVNQRLYEAVLIHKELVAFDNSVFELDRALAWVLLGLAARAHDRGVPIEVQSDYLPLWMVRGEWPE